MIVRTLFGDKPGPTITVIVCIHGNETCGLSAIKAITNIERGTLHIITANTLAIKKEKRFIETDLNRSFLFPSSYEGKIAKEISYYLDKSDALLDIHASTTPNSEPFCICEKQSFSIARKLPGKYIVTNISSIHSGSTDGYMNCQNKVAICMECGYLDDITSHTVSLSALLSFLGEFEMISYESKQKDKTLLRVYDHHICENNFKSTMLFDDFEKIEKGTKLGSDGDIHLESRKRSRILFSKQNVPKNSISYVLLEEF